MVARALLLRPKLIVADEPVSMVDASLRMTILANMQQLKTEHGISVVYITHDLATAYQVADYVLVLHEGHIVEAGAADEVIEHPAHPYTHSLVDAIPWPDPDRRWPELDPDMRSRMVGKGNRPRRHRRIPTGTDKRRLTSTVRLLVARPSARCAGTVGGEPDASVWRSFRCRLIAKH